MENFIVGLAIAIVIAIPSIYIAKKKKQGVQCIGCPHSKMCQGHCPSKK